MRKRQDRCGKVPHLHPGVVEGRCGPDPRVGVLVEQPRHQVRRERADPLRRRGAKPV